MSVNEWFDCPACPVVFGLRLRPLQLGHLLLLAELNSPLASGDDDARFTPDDLLAAVFVLSQDHTSSRRDLGKWWLPVFLRFWAWRVSRSNYALEQAKFLAWWKAVHELPRFKPPPAKQGREVAAPFVIQLLAFCMAHMNMSEADALSIPFRRAFCYFAAWAEIEDRASLRTPRESDLWAHQARLDQEVFGTTTHN